ncbi:MAG: N-acetyl sugar amidotransferase [Planctomycetota bacterium]
MPRYCQSCILPDTRPGVHLNADGVCNACKNVAGKSAIDWAARHDAFVELVKNVKAHDTGRAAWDCVIPVSGGKDSFWQVVTCLEHGLRPLCITYSYPGQNDHGRRNLQKLIAIGVDHFDFHLNPRVERTFIEQAFRKTAISGLVTHMAIFTVPLNMAIAYGIPLVVYGENTAFEYGDSDDALTGALLDRAWLKKFGVTEGTEAHDWIGHGGLTHGDLRPLAYPTDAQLTAAGTRAIFMGYYFPWDVETSARTAFAHGFQGKPDGALVGTYDYVNIDDIFIPVHHHPKWHKFGITRSWDNLSIEIRNGRITRDAAINKLRDIGDETPTESIRAFSEYLGIGVAEYHRIVESFRNPAIWSRRDNRWVIDDFLVPDFPWPEDPAT